ncbi:MAG: 2-oxoacid:acceptor oxidoreductase family protein [Candidatus Hydrogenedentes bacterium]|nr:2-oxoacid:acceptor oxidoreductase family protein [Candidatus Hydrogenedentota bacterium]
MMQIRFGGYGGQGIVLTGMLLGKAATLYDKKEAVFTQSHGPEARGGASSADVIIAERAIDYPFLAEPDVLVVLFQEAYMQFRSGLRPGGTLIIEADLVHPIDGEGPLHSLPATRLAEGLGNRIVTNVVVLGYVVGLTGVVSRKAAEEAIRTSVKSKFIDLNLRAFETGFERAQSEVCVK